MRIKIIVLVATLSFIAAGCGGAQYAFSSDYSPERHDYLRADDSTAYASCLAVCSENTSLALVTRTGCLEGCDEARRSFSLNNRVFSSRQDCSEFIVSQKLSKTERILELRAWCDGRWTHVHNRKGCYRGIDAFSDALDSEPMCGSDVNDAAVYIAPQELLREDAAEYFSPSATSDKVQDAPVAAPASEAVTAKPPLAPTGPTQPAGTILPSPYVPEQPLENSDKPTPETPSPQPAEVKPIISDIPKYQKPSASKPVKSTKKSFDSDPVEKVVIPLSAPKPIEVTPLVAPKPKTAQNMPSSESAKPDQPTTAPTTPNMPDPSATLSTPTAPPLPVTSEIITSPVATPEMPLPAPAVPAEIKPAQAAPIPPATSSIKSSEAAGQASRIPIPTVTIPLVTTPGPGLPTSSKTPSVPSSPVAPPTAAATVAQPAPAQALPGNTNSVGIPDISGSNPTPVRQGTSRSGINANRPIPSDPEPPQQDPTVVILPVPSMLNRPYNAPTIIEPQIDIPEEDAAH